MQAQRRSVGAPGARWHRAPLHSAPFHIGGANCWADMMQVTLHLQDPQMPTEARCRQRFSTVLEAKRECEAATWCGGVSRDSGIACANGRLRFELRTGVVEGAQRLSDGSLVVSHLLRRGLSGDACLRFRGEQAGVSHAFTTAARRVGFRGGKMALPPSAAELRQTRLVMA
jgi:hypothetical protein